MPDSGGHDHLREWQAAMQSVVSSATSAAGRSALTESARALEQAAGMMEVQAELFERAIQTLRGEIAKAAAGLERRPSRARPWSAAMS